MNPVLKNLGYSEKDRVLLIHADDVGINHASIEAYEELMDLGTISCGSVMAHSSWLPEVVRRAKENPNWDLGVHLAFNCEYDSYRWRPLSTQDPASGLVDEYGYFKQSAMDVAQTADPLAVAKEIQAQIELVQNLGLDITHVDSHSGTLWNNRFVRSYADVLKEHKLFPVLLSADFFEKLQAMGLGGLSGGGEYWQELETENFPFVDGVAGLPMDQAVDVDDRFELAKKMLLDVEPGKLVHFAFHPMKDTEEARGLNRYCDARTGDYKTFIKKEMKQFMENQGIQLIGYNQVRDALGLTVH